MRRSIGLLVMVAASFVTPLAFGASEPSAADAGADTGAPTSSSSSVVAAPSASAQTSATTPKSETVAPPAEKPAVTEEQVFQLGRLVELEADRARGRRYVGSTIGMLSAAGVITGGALVFTVNTAGVDPNFVTLFQVLGGLEIGLGAVMGVESLISLFVESPMERMFDAYAPIAIDKRLTPAERLHRGEALLEAMANRERSARMTGIVGDIIAGVAVTALDIWLVADNDFWGSDPTSNLYRPLVGTIIGFGVVSMVGDVVAKMLWERGPAELAWEHWHVSHEPASVQTSRLQLRPLFAPTVGGLMGGLSARF